MKLRRIGNSLGTTFSRAALQKAGLVEGQELDIIASPGEIRIVPAKQEALAVCFTVAEAAALVEGRLDSKDGKAALKKVRVVAESDL